MISQELEQRALLITLDSEDRFELRVEFGVACVNRVETLITNKQVQDAFTVGKLYLSGSCSQAELHDAALRASELAQSHPGSGSIDGTGSAAVTTSRGVAAALAGRALEAAGYAAYASVYAYASHAVTDVSAYRSEHAWQLDRLNSLAQKSRL